MKFILDLIWERDLSVNSYRFGKPSPKARGKWKKARVRKPHVQAWHNRAVWEIRLARQMQLLEDTGRTFRWDHGPPIKLPVFIRVDYRWPDKRRRDTGNYRKVLEDAIKAAIDVDDRHFRVTDGDVTVDRENPGFSVEVSDERKEP